MRLVSPQRLATLELEDAAFHRATHSSAIGLESPSRGRAAAVPVPSQAYSQNSALRFATRLCVKLAKQGEQTEETKINENLVGAYAAVLVSCMCRGNEVRGRLGVGEGTKDTAMQKSGCAASLIALCFSTPTPRGLYRS